MEYSVKYDGAGVAEGNPSNIAGNCALSKEDDGNKFNTDTHGCVITFDIESDMEAPIFVYYQLDNFYQNHRRYVQSRSDGQLRGDTAASLSNCDPLPTDTGLIKYDSVAEDPLNTDTTKTYKLNPCGLIANSLFNGDFTINYFVLFMCAIDIIWMNSITDTDGKTYYQKDTYEGNTVVNTMNQEGIAWQSDIDTKFKNIPTSERSDQDLYLWQNPKYRYIVPKEVGQKWQENVTAWTKDTTSFGVQNEHFIVWMRTAGLPNFRKLYGKINTNLKKGMKVSFLVSSNFVVQSFDGNKYLVLSTTSWFGGRNPFLGISYITVGSLCLVLALLFFAKHKVSPRKLGDTRYLVWKHNQ